MIGVRELLLAAAPGAALGGLLVHRIGPDPLLVAVGLVLILSGPQGLVRAPALTPPPPSSRVLVLVGFGVGLGSALKGTGGPVLLIPVMLALRQPLQPVIAASLVIQLPVGASAALGHYLANAIDGPFALQLGTVLIAAAAFGRWCTHRVSTRLLHGLATLMLIGVGVWILGRLLF